MKILLLLSLLNSYVDGQYLKGGIVGVIKNGKTEIVKYGETHSQHSVTANDKTIFELGSITKVFTGIILGALVNRQVVSLDDIIEKFIPEIKGLAVGKITLRELSTHTSSLPRLPSNIVFPEMNDPYRDYDETLLLEFLRNYNMGDRPVVFSWKNYSNLGVGLLGYTLARATGTTYQELLENYITKPLGMKNTTTKLNGDQIQYKATKYDAILSPIKFWNMNALLAAGGIKSNLEDMLIFLNNMIDTEKSPIKEDLKKSVEIQHCDGKNCIGLGWGIYKEEFLRSISHGGSTAGFFSMIEFRTDKRQGFIALSTGNTNIQCLSNIIMWDNKCQPEFGVTVPEKKLQQYSGEYFGHGMQINIFKVAKHLVYEIVGQEMSQLKAVAENKFTIDDNVEFLFKSDQLLLKQSGQVFTFKKSAPLALNLAL